MPTESGLRTTVCVLANTTPNSYLLPVILMCTRMKLSVFRPIKYGLKQQLGKALDNYGALTMINSAQDCTEDGQTFRSTVCSLILPRQSSDQDQYDKLANKYSGRSTASLWTSVLGAGCGGLDRDVGCGDV